MTMRRHVRYKPLGKPKKVNIQLGITPGSHEGLVVDESKGGLCLQLPADCGVMMGQQVEIEMRTGAKLGKVVRLDRESDGSYLAGISFDDD